MNRNKINTKKGFNGKMMLFFLLLFCMGRNGYAQIYPVQLTTQLAPPFSGYIGDYSTPGNQNLKLLVLFSDFTKPTYSIKLKMKISGQGITIQSKSYFYSQAFSVQPGIPFEISGSDLAELLNTNNLDFSGISIQQYEEKKALPEGFYNICFIAYDNNNPTQIQVSNESCAAGWMVLSDPPFLNLPMCGSVIKIIDPQNIFFQWTPMNLSSPNSAMNTLYDFELYEVKPAAQSPGNIIQTLPPIYKITTPLTSINYGMTEPQLYPAMEYVWRVRAHDLSGRDLFKNQGYSQICTFTYGTKFNAIDSSALKLNLKGTPLSYRMIKYTWDSLAIFSSYELEYRKQGGTNWFPVYSSSNAAIVNNLEPQSTYEAHVRGVAQEGTGPWSNIVTITTPAKPIIVCGQSSAPPSMDNFKPLVAGKKGQVWTVGQFDMLVTRLESENNPSGLYSGYGKIEVPFLGGLNLIGQFQNILINDEYELVQGQVDIISGGMGNILNLDSLFNEIDKLFDDFYTNKDTAVFVDKLLDYKNVVCANLPPATSKFLEEEAGKRVSGEEEAQLLCSINKEDALELIVSGKITQIKDKFKEAEAKLTACTFDAGGKYFLAPNGKIIQLPDGAKLLTNIDAYNNGAVHGFAAGKKNYYAALLIGQPPAFGGFKNGETVYPFSYIKKADVVHVLITDEKGIKIYAVKNYIAPETEDMNFETGPPPLVEGAELVFTCLKPKADPPKENTTTNVNADAYVFKQGRLTEIKGDKATEISFSANDLKALKEKISKGDITGNATVLIEETQDGYTTTVGFNKSLKAKDGYGNSEDVKKESKQILENKINAYLKTVSDVNAAVSPADIGAFSDGKKISFNGSQTYCKVIRNVVHDAAVFIQQAQIPPSYYNSSNANYSGNWINTPPLVTGIANGFIDEAKDIPVLIAFGADIAMNKEVQTQLKNSLSKLTTWEGIKEAASNVVKDWKDNYTQGGDQAWHQGGKDAVAVFSIGKAAAAIASSIKNGLEKKVDDVVEVVNQAGKWLDDLDLLLGAGTKTKINNWISKGLSENKIEAAFAKSTDKAGLLNKLDNSKSVYHQRVHVEDWDNIPGIMKSNYTPNGLTSGKTHTAWNNSALDLPSSEAANFVNAMAVELPAGTKIYRVTGGNPAGGYWTIQKPNSVGDVIGGTAVQPAWNDFSKMYVYEVPHGQTLKVWQGTTAKQPISQGVTNPHLPGGDQQLFIPDVIRDNAFKELVKPTTLPW